MDLLRLVSNEGMQITLPRPMGRGGGFLDSTWTPDRCLDPFAIARNAYQPRHMSEIRLYKAVDSPEWELPDETRLWRYVPLKTLFVYLSGAVFIPSIETLRKQDPFEGDVFIDFIPNGWITQVVENWHGGAETADVRQWLIQHGLCAELQKFGDNPETYYNAYLHLLQGTRCAWCWFEATENSESAAMWNLYGKDGVAITTTVGRLRAALGKQAASFEFSRMGYISVGRGGIKRSPYPDGVDWLLRPHYLKRSEYSSEQEIRFVTALPKPSPGALLTLQPTEWIEEIMLYPGFEETEAKALQTAIQKALPHIRCTQSGLLGKRPENIFEKYIACLEEEIPEGLQRLWPRDED